MITKNFFFSCPKYPYTKIRENSPKNTNILNDFQIYEKRKKKKWFSYIMEGKNEKLFKNHVGKLWRGLFTPKIGKFGETI